MSYFDHIWWKIFFLKNICSFTPVIKISSKSDQKWAKTRHLLLKVFKTPKCLLLPHSAMVSRFLLEYQWSNSIPGGKAYKNKTTKPQWRKGQWQEHQEEPAPSPRQQGRRGQQPRPSRRSHRAEPGFNSESNHNYLTFSRFETRHVADMLSLRINKKNYKGYNSIDKNRGPISKNGVLGRKPNILGQKKAFTS